MFQGLRTASYNTSDLAKAKAWYSEVLGIQPYFDDPFYVGFNVGGFELGLVPVASTNNSGEGGARAYWGVADAEAAFKQLLALGAQAHSLIQDVGDNILIGSVIDPFGNILGIITNPNFKLP